MSGLAIYGKRSLYRAIASLCRQTAALRPMQGRSWLAQAADWEKRAVTNLERYLASSAARLLDCARRRGSTAQFRHPLRSHVLFVSTRAAPIEVPRS
nr:hypothetical protein [Bradyrhizobium sacchari]